MRTLLYCSILYLVFGYQNAHAQCDFITPPVIKKVNYASREITFSDVTINGSQTTYLAVDKGASVKITTRLESKQRGDYCPSCIVQIYWGIRGHASVCANSYYGFKFNGKKSTQTFQAPMEDGIYYITMGGTLDYSCKNNKYRPSCSPDDAFAVLKVGNPDPEQKITMTKVERGSNVLLKTTLVKRGCFGDLDQIKWSLNGSPLAYDNKQEIPMTKPGIYKVIWSNCLTSITDSLIHSAEDLKAFKPKVVSTSINSTAKEPKRYTLSTGSATRKDLNGQEVRVYQPKVATTTSVNTDIVSLIENNDTFVMQNLIFDLGKSDLKPEAKVDLDQLAQIMLDKPSMSILLEGHTDARGGARKNQVLSENRVKAAKIYLVGEGVDSSRISTKGWGHQRPLIVTKDIEEGKVNRRVEIRILSR